MIETSTIYTFIIATFLIAITPGPDQIYIATRSLAQGKNAGLVSALGINTGLLLHVLGAALGLSAFIAASPMIFTIIKYFGAAYLLFLGIRTLLTKLANSDDDLYITSTKGRLEKVYYEGLITNLLNPRASLFFWAFLPQFVDQATSNTTRQIIILGLIAILVSLLTDLGIILFATLIGDQFRQLNLIRNAGTWAVSLMFILLGIATALS